MREFQLIEGWLDIRFNDSDWDGPRELRWSIEVWIGQLSFQIDWEVS